MNRECSKLKLKHISTKSYFERTFIKAASFVQIEFVKPQTSKATEKKEKKQAILS